MCGGLAELRGSLIFARKNVERVSVADDLLVNSEVNRLVFEHKADVLEPPDPTIEGLIRAGDGDVAQMEDPVVEVVVREGYFEVVRAVRHGDGLDYDEGSTRRDHSSELVQDLLIILLVVGYVGHETCAEVTAAN